MKYTIQKGVQRPYSARISDNVHFILPLLVIFGGVLFFALANSGPRHAQTPLTLGIYTVKTPDDSKSSNNKPDGNGNSPNTGGSSSTPQAPLATSTPASAGSTLSAASSAQTTTGGLGGGSGAIVIPPAPAPPPVTPTVTNCVDMLTGTTLVCVLPYETCAPALGTIADTGVKTIDGTCIKIN